MSDPWQCDRCDENAAEEIGDGVLCSSCADKQRVEDRFRRAQRTAIETWNSWVSDVQEGSES